MSSETSTPAKRVGRPKAGAARLTKDRILRAALDLVDEHGLPALSMRRLARELDADPMSIYHHLPNKAAIVSGLVHAVFAEMRMPDTAVGTWVDQVRTWVWAYRDLTRAHPNLVLQIVTDVTAASEAVILISEPLYAALESAGLPPATIAHASGMLVDYVNGFALGEAGVGTGTTPGRDEVAEQLATLDPTSLPTMRRVHAAKAAVPAMESCTSGFEISIDIMIDGLRALSTTSPVGRSR